MFGFIPFSHGLSLIVTADESEEVTIEGNTFKLEKLTSVNLFPEHKDEQTALFKRIKINFDTMVIFEGDEVGLTATATGVDPKVNAIALVITNPTEKLSQLSLEYLGKEIEAKKDFGQVIELAPFTNPPFHSRVIIPFSETNQDVIIFGVIRTEDGLLHGLRSDQVITTVHPRTDKLQAETNKAILKQIEETEKQTIQQDETNTLFLGLTWIGVSAFPLWFGGEIILRIHLKE